MEIAFCTFQNVYIQVVIQIIIQIITIYYFTLVLP